MAVNTRSSTSDDSANARLGRQFAAQQIKNIITSLGIVDKFQDELLSSAANPGYETHASKIVKANQTLNLIIEDIKFQLSVELYQITIKVRTLNEIYEKIEQIELQIERENQNILRDSNTKEKEFITKISEDIETLKQVIHDRILQLESLITQLQLNINFLTDQINHLTEMAYKQEVTLRQIIDGQLDLILPSEPIIFQLPSIHDNEANTKPAHFELSDGHLKEMYREAIVNQSNSYARPSVEGFVEKVKNDILENHLKDASLSPSQKEIYKKEFDIKNKLQFKELFNQADKYDVIFENEGVINGCNDLFSIKDNLKSFQYAREDQVSIFHKAQAALNELQAIEISLSANNLNVSVDDISSLLESASTFSSNEFINSPSTIETLQTNFDELMASINIETDLSLVNLTDINLADLKLDMPSFESLSNETSSTSSMLKQLAEGSAKAPDANKEATAPAAKGVIAESSYRPGLFDQSAQKHQIAQKTAAAEPAPADDELKNKK